MKRSKGLLKRAAAYLAAGTIIATMLPMTFASAEMIDGTKWETISEIKFTDFSDLTDPANSRWDPITATKTVDGVTYGIELIPGGASPIGNNTGYIYYTNSKNWGWDSGKDYLSNNLPVSMSDKLIWNRRCYVQSGINKWSSPTQALRIKNIFGATQLNRGDKVRITAYVNTYGTEYWNPASNAGIDPNDAEGSLYPSTNTANIRMWLSQNADESLGWGNYYPQNTMGMTNSAEYTRKELTKKEWGEVSLEYTINEANENVKCVRIDSGLLNESTEIYDFPREIFVAKLKVERLVKSSGTYAIDSATGKCSGNVTTILTSEPDAASNPKVLIAAYSGNDLVGCNVKEYSDTNSYDFEISNAAGADRVVAYLWYMDNIEPKIEAINLKAQ